GDGMLRRRRAQVAEAPPEELGAGLVGHLRKGGREGGQRLPPLLGGEVERGAAQGPAERLRRAKRQQTDEGQRCSEEPVAQCSLQTLGQGWCHRGKRTSYDTAGVELRRAGGAHPLRRRT